MSKLFSFFIVLVIGLALGYALALSLLAPSAQTAVATSTSASSASISLARINDSSNTYEIDAQYPQFGIPAIDAKIRASVDTEIQRLKSAPANPSPNNIKNEFQSVFEGAYVSDALISVRMIYSEYTGGAHPNYVIATLNYDPATGRELSLTDALTLTGLSLEQLAERASQELRAKLGEAMFVEGATAKPENYAAFLVTENQVTFIFQPYQVAAYAAGAQEVAFERVQ